MARQITINTFVDKFFGKIPLTDPTLAEIKSAIDEQKFISEIVNKFFEDSKPQNITTKISDIDKYVRDRAAERPNPPNILPSHFFSMIEAPDC